MRDETLDLRLNASPHDFGWLARRSPLRIKGRFSAPQIRLDRRRIGDLSAKS